MTKIISILLAAIVVVALVIAGIVIYQWQQFMQQPLVTHAQVFELTPGANVKKLSHDLTQQGIIDRPRFFEWLVRVRGETKKLKAGEYQVEPGITIDQLLSKFVRGDVILHHFTIIEGWTFKQLLAAVEANPYLHHDITTKDPAVAMDELDYPGVNPEGRFYPDTYFFAKGVADKVVLEKSYQKMKRVLHQAWLERATNLPYKTSYDALIVASMIEKETAVPKERPMVAGVIINRLNKNMRLQIDPTVIYGMGDEYNDSLTRKDLQTKTPYNTYTNKGLPPTPICMPSTTSILAALHPDHTDALYYVAKGDGSHVFSVTLKEHDAAIKKYLLNDSESSPSKDQQAHATVTKENTTTVSTNEAVKNTKTTHSVQKNAPSKPETKRHEKK